MATLTEPLFKMGDIVEILNSTHKRVVVERVSGEFGPDRVPIYRVRYGKGRRKVVDVGQEQLKLIRTYAEENERKARRRKIREEVQRKVSELLGDSDDGAAVP